MLYTRAAKLTCENHRKLKNAPRSEKCEVDEIAHVLFPSATSWGVRTSGPSKATKHEHMDLWKVPCNVWRSFGRTACIRVVGKLCWSIPQVLLLSDQGFVDKHLSFSVVAPPLGGMRAASGWVERKILEKWTTTRIVESYDFSKITLVTLICWSVKTIQEPV